MPDKLDPDIETLTQKVIEAANGKPLKKSITAMKMQERSVGEMLKKMIAAMFAGEQDGTKRVDKSGGTTSSSQAAKPESPQVITQDDLVGIRKSIDQLSTNLAGMSK